ncbi:MAG: peptidoglycan DD-metalloendopeptidase family protein [Lachnospiraceae bacterium]|nr:peptidoglycan DD-metalloendopeptidase family protein [Lachnospiraceae bacterium]
MERKKHKKRNHVIIVTSDAVDADAKQFQIKPWLLQIIIIVGCVLIGAAVGCFIYEKDVWEVANRRIDEQKILVDDKEHEIQALNEQIKELQAKIEDRDDKINILSDTVNQKTAEVQGLAETLAAQALPTEYPLTGSASIEESKEGDPICIFTASAGVTVVATARGTVTAINEDAGYGRNVWIDHGNGYITIYRNQGETSVKLGDEVAQGTTIFIINTNNKKFAYQIMKDGAYIDPMEMLSISG